MKRWGVATGRAVFLGRVMDTFHYSECYEDGLYRYRHVLVRDLAVVRLLPKDTLLPEVRWRSLGICMGPGWEHYMLHAPERHVLLFRKPLEMARQPDRAKGDAGHVSSSTSLGTSCDASSTSEGGGSDSSEGDGGSVSEKSSAEPMSSGADSS